MKIIKAIKALAVILGIAGIVLIWGTAGTSDIRHTPVYEIAIRGIFGLGCLAAGIELSEVK